MSLTNDDLNQIDSRIKSNNRDLEKRLTDNIAEMMAENNQILISGLMEFVKNTCETQEIKKQLRQHDKRLMKIETLLQNP